MADKTITNDEIKFLFSEDQIKDRTRELALKINEDYNGKEVTAVCILKGGMLFFTDLIRDLNMPVRCEFMATSSYGDEKKSSGEVMLTMDTKFPLEGKHILVVEDIVDSGLTLSYILKLLNARNPASVKLCSMLFKPQSLKTELQVDYVGFEIGNDFVVGYGLDYKGLYRNLPYVGVMPD